ncbi:hypothetical protein Pcinc_043271 [Petrolisthes cinctipes]|uniref:Uncharacterized protein n=1 Tax=Petrolisthes cinctipes TaxID=88211 RepID=A0AAE1BFX2_PETCI|nr:hypothetical protein Pcinc_043271 [Petrolisthes cinctipes]
MVVMVMMVMVVYAKYKDLLLDECIVTTKEKTFTTYDTIVPLHLAMIQGKKPIIEVNDMTLKDIPSKNSLWIKGYLKLDGNEPVFSRPRPNQTETKLFSTIKLTGAHYYTKCSQDKPNYVLNSMVNSMTIPRFGSDYEELLVFAPNGAEFNLTIENGSDDGCPFNLSPNSWFKINLQFSTNSVKVTDNNDTCKPELQGTHVQFVPINGDLYIIQCNGTCGVDGNSTTATATTSSVSTPVSTTTTKNRDQVENEVLEIDQQIVILYVVLGILLVICVVLCLALVHCWASRKKERGQISTKSDPHKATAMTPLPGHNNSQPGISYHNNLVHDEANDLYEPLDEVGLKCKKPDLGVSSGTSFTEVNDVYESLDHQTKHPAAPTTTSYDEANNVYESFDHQTTHPAAPTTTSYDEANNVYESFDHQTTHPTVK